LYVYVCLRGSMTKQGGWLATPSTPPGLAPVSGMYINMKSVYTIVQSVQKLFFIIHLFRVYTFVLSAHSVSATNILGSDARNFI